MQEILKINSRIVLRVIGILLCIEALFMLLPLGISIIYGENDLYSFISSILITFASGFLLTCFFRNHNSQFAKREGFLIVSLSWVFFSFFGMLPFLIGGYIESVADAYFETISGFTTTGASILDDIESLPHGILFWRSLIQWLGGMGIILFTLAVMPMLNSGGGIQLFNAEVTGIKHSKLRPRISQTAKRLWLLYTVITLILTALLVLGPMNLFDSICHAFTAMSTGGYSTKQSSIAYWHSSYVDYILIIFMIIGSINFSLVYHAVAGNVKQLFKDEEVKWFLAIVLIATIAITAGLYVTNQDTGFESTFRAALFQVTTLMTTTGYATADYVAWGPFFCVILLIVMFFGACAGSTSGGAKIVRIIVAFKNTANEFYRHLHPHAIIPVKINNQVISHELVSKILSFIFVYILIIMGSTLILTTLGSSFEEAIGSSITCISNVGPGLDTTGPSGSFSHLPVLAKWTLSFVMLIGRLELFTVLIIFTPYFWKK